MTTIAQALDKAYQSIDRFEAKLLLATLLGKGRAKKGIFEGNLEEGELEIGQIASLFREEQSVEEVMQELISDFHAGIERISKLNL